MFERLTSSSDVSRALIAIMALAMAPAIGLGIGRFAYGLVLPDMQAAFGWSYGQAGLPNALNALGYFVGAFTAGRAAAAVGGLRLVLISSAIAALATFASAFAIGLVSLSALRFVAGVSAAYGVVAGGAVAISVAERAEGRGSLIVGLFYAGPPVGIIVSALVAPLALGLSAEEGWRYAWGALGLASLVLLAPLASPSLRSAPGERGTVAGASARLLPMAPALASYVAFGMGYIAYMTFMIAYLRADGASASEEAAFWCVIGLAGVAAPFVWARALAALKGGLGLAASTAVTALGAATPLLSRTFAAELLSAAIFGLGMFTVVAATTIFVRRNLPPAAWASGVGAMTVAFSLGQTIGPVLTGLVTDHLGGLNAGLGFGALMLGLGALLAATQRDIVRVADQPVALAEERLADRAG